MQAQQTHHTSFPGNPSRHQLLACSATIVMLVSRTRQTSSLAQPSPASPWSASDQCNIRRSPLAPNTTRATSPRASIRRLKELLNLFLHLGDLDDVNARDKKSCRKLPPLQ